MRRVGAVTLTRDFCILAEGRFLGTDSLGIPDIEDPEVIGRGSFGVVYRARQTKLGRTIAVKVIDDATLDDAARLRFTRECQAMGALSGHPNVVMVFDSGFTTDGKPYLMLEYLPDGSLGDRIRDGGAFGFDAATTYIIKIAGALESVHRMGVLHRDVKPDNILLDRFNEPKLCDFGIAWVAGTSATRTAAIMGSPAYMGPEVIQGHATSAASDIYALSATLYVLLSSSEAFRKEEGETIVELLLRIASQQPPDLRPRVPDPVWQVIARGLSKDPAGRPPSPLAFAADLNHARAALGLAPIEAMVTNDPSAPSGPRPTAIPARPSIGPLTPTGPGTGSPGLPGSPMGVMQVPTAAPPPVPMGGSPTTYVGPPPMPPLPVVVPTVPLPESKDRTIPILIGGAVIVVLMLVMIALVAANRPTDVVTGPTTTTTNPAASSSTTAQPVDLVQGLVTPSAIGLTWAVDAESNDTFTGFNYLEPCNKKIDVSAIKAQEHVVLVGRDPLNTPAQSFQALAEFDDADAAASFIATAPDSLKCKTWQDSTLGKHRATVETIEAAGAEESFLAQDIVLQGQDSFTHDLAFFRVGRFVGFITNLSVTPNDREFTTTLLDLFIAKVNALP